MRSAALILAEALDLPEADRAQMALRLSESVSAAPVPEVGAPAAWANEISRRLARLADGTARTVSTEEALDQAFARLAARRA